jgi:protein-S-isoprenylcysteine O-methyltransferase Ste14
MNYLILFLLWILWCFTHSFLITTKTTTRVKNILGNKYAWYRIAYNIFSLATVLPLLYWQRTIPGPVILSLSPYLMIFKNTALILSLIVVAGSFFSFDVMEFAGFRQVSGRSRKKEHKFANNSSQPVISKHGFYRIVRHPMYLGGFVFLCTSMMNAPLAQFIGYGILAVYMIVGTFTEDRRLARELGDVYRNYQKEVGSRHYN